MVNYARRLRANVEFEIKTQGNIYAFDSSIISLCLSVFWWATYKRNSGAVRIHTLLDIKTQIPCFMLVTPASTNDIKAMEHIPYEKGSFYIFDRGYNSFADLYSNDVKTTNQITVDNGEWTIDNSMDNGKTYPLLYGMAVKFLVVYITVS